MKISGQFCKERNNLIAKFATENIEEKLCLLLGDDFRNYRKLYHATEQYQETKTLPVFPVTLYFELINRCNLKCKICYLSHRKSPKTSLSLDVLDKIFVECKNKVPAVVLGMGAEQLLYKDLGLVFEKIRNANVRDIFFGTNGVLLNDYIIEEIFKNKITRIKISLDAAYEKTYRKIRGKNFLRLIENNIDKIIRRKEKENLQIPFIRLSFILLKDNKSEVRRFITKWQHKVDYIDFQKYLDFSHIDNEIDTIEYKKIKNCFCSNPFNSLAIWSNGDVSPCCSFYGLKLIVGNVYSDSIENIWHGDKISKIRQQIIGKKFNTACQRCLYFRDEFD